MTVSPSIAELEARLAESRKELDEFVYRVSHDLQAPLRAVAGFSTMLANSAMDRLDEQEKQDLVRVMHAAKLAQQLLDSTLRYSRLNSQPVKLKAVDTNEVMVHAVTALGEKIKKTQAKLEVEKLPPVLADEARLDQIFQAIIENALKFITTGQMPVVRISGAKQNGEVIIAIEDEGIGIEERHGEKCSNYSAS